MADDSYRVGLCLVPGTGPEGRPGGRTHSITHCMCQGTGNDVASFAGNFNKSQHSSLY
jgi:hypothetical protein